MLLRWHVEVELTCEQMLMTGCPRGVMVGLRSSLRGPSHHAGV